MNVDCATARNGLWPPDRPRLADAEAIAARRHVAACAACQDYFAQDRTLLEVYDRLRANPAPAPVRERVFDTLARERTAGATTPDRERRARIDRRATRAAATVLVVLGAGMAGWLLLPDRGAPSQPAGMFAEDWLRRAVAEDHIDSADPAQIRDFLARELGIVHTPLRIAGLSPVSAEICLLDGRRAAMITYAAGDRSIAHYVLPAPGARDRDPSLAASADVPDRPAIVTWAAASLEHALVGHLPRDSLLDLARRHVPRLPRPAPRASQP